MSDNNLYLLAYQNQLLTPVALADLTTDAQAMRLRLAKLPGSRQLRLVLTLNQQTLLRAELDWDDLSYCNLEILRHSQTHYSINCLDGSTVRLLKPSSEISDFESPIDWRLPATSLDICIIIDATMRLFTASQEEDVKSPSSKLLLSTDNRSHWQLLVTQISELVSCLQSYWQQCRISVLAFADQEMPENINAKDLLPVFFLFPEEASARCFSQFDMQQLQQQLLQIPASSGGDYIDALADALHAVNQDLRWQSDRKLIFICGDSPGYSILQPIPKANACVRQQDIESAALRLHRKGIVISTLYINPADDVISDIDNKEKRLLLQRTREQYQNLASLTDLAFAYTTFDPQHAAQTIASIQGLIGYAGCCGIWAEDA